MTRANDMPPGATPIRTYRDLRQYSQAFADEKIHLLIVGGLPGLGKSRLMKEVIGSKARWIEGNATAFRAYIDLYLHRDQPIVLDDVGGLDNNPEWVHLFKTLCQTDPVKTVGWHSQATALEKEGVPRQFETTSRVCLICNRLRARNPDVEAVLDRGHTLMFDPSPNEVHAQTALWFADAEVFEFVARTLHLTNRVSMRDYHRAAELKAAGLDWRGMLLNRWGVNEKTVAVAKLKADLTFGSEEDRATAFVASGYGSRSSYFVHAKKLNPSAAVPTVLLGEALATVTDGTANIQPSRKVQRRGKPRPVKP